MRFPAPLFPATLVRRYKRFIADVVLPSGQTVRNSSFQTCVRVRIPHAIPHSFAIFWMNQLKPFLVRESRTSVVHCLSRLTLLALFEQHQEIADIELSTLLTL